MRGARRLGLYKKGSVLIDIGSAATNRTGDHIPNYTFILKDNPANAAGTITSIEVWAADSLIGFEVATFYSTGTNEFSTRSTATIGSVTAGSKQTFSVSLSVEAGDYIGFYCSSGRIEADSKGAGGASHWYKSGDNIPCTTTTFLNSTDDKNASLYGSGSS